MAGLEGGVNLDQIRDKCIEDGDCWIWTGIASSSGVPKINIFVGRGKSGRTVVSTRRVVWELVKGPIPARKLITTNCGCVKCLNPDHLVLTTAAKVAEKNGARVDVRLKKSRAGAARLAKAKLTWDQVEEIRASEGTTRELSQRYGVGRSAICNIRAGRTWRDYSNPFAGLAA
jgi:hypothetical protein